MLLTPDAPRENLREFIAVIVMVLLATLAAGLGLLVALVLAGTGPTDDDDGAGSGSDVEAATAEPVGPPLLADGQDNLRAAMGAWRERAAADA